MTGTQGRRTQRAPRQGCGWSCLHRAWWSEFAGCQRDLQIRRVCHLLWRPAPSHL